MKKNLSIWKMASAALAALSLGLTLSASGATITVGPSGCDYTTIQAAITAATAGDTINVAAGTYVESNIAITKALTIQGGGATRDDVVIVPAAEDGNANSAFGTSAQNGLIVAAHNVTIAKITINGQGNPALTVGKSNFRAAIVTADAGQSPAPPVTGGIWSNLHVDDVSVKNIYRRGISVTPAGCGGTLVEHSGVDNVVLNHGIYVMGQGQVISNTVNHAFQGIVMDPTAATPAGLVKVIGNVLTDIGNVPTSFGYPNGQPRAIQCNPTGPARAFEVRDNTISDNGLELYGGTVGIYTRLWTSASVLSGNHITLSSGVSWADTGSQSVGLLLGWNYDEGFAVVSNHVHSSKYGMGVMVFGSGSAAKPLVLDGNTLTSTASAALDTGDGTGIYVANQYLFASDKSPSVLVVSGGNSIGGFVKGINAELIPTSTKALTVAAHGNTIVGNTTGIDAATLTTAMDASSNWWGAADGPAGAGPGTGDAVSANVLFDPWYNTAEMGTRTFEDVIEAIPGGGTTTLLPEPSGSTVLVDLDVGTPAVSFTAALEEGIPAGGFTGMGGSQGIAKSLSVTTAADDGAFVMVVAIHYTDAELAASGVSESDLRLYWWNTAALEWQLAVAGNTRGTLQSMGNMAPPTSPTVTDLGQYGVDTANNLIWAVVDHTSDYSGGEGPSEAWVDLAYTAATPDWHNTCFDKIQDAIDSCAAGATIHVATGTYIGNVNIDRALTLTGSSVVIQGNVTVGATSTMTGITLASGYACNVTAGGSIQAAIDAAPVGSTVSVATGTYTENVTIHKALTLTGSSTVIDGDVTFSAAVTMTGITVATGHVCSVTVGGSIQAAIDAAPAGGTVIVAAGTYQPSLAGWKELEILKSLTLVGAGSGATIIQFTSGVMNGLEIRGSDLDVTLQGLTFTREDASANSANFALRIGETVSTFSNLTLRDVEVAYAAANNLWTGATITSLTVEDCNFHHSSDYGFTSYGTITSGTIDNSHFDDNTGTGLQLAGPTTNVLVTGGTMNHNGAAGFSGRQLSGVTFRDVVANNNHATDGYGFAIIEKLAGSGSSNVSFENVTANDNDVDGILVVALPGYAISHVSVLGGTFNHNDRNGIRVETTLPGGGGTISDITIDGVTVSNPGKEAILVQSGVGAPVIASVQVRNCTLTSANTLTAANNTLQLAFVQGGTISGNTVRNSRSNGIVALDCSSLDIDSNDASTNVAGGITLVRSTGIDVTRNTVRSNQGNAANPGGITIRTSCSNVAVKNNKVEANVIGLWVGNIAAGAGIAVNHNSISGNTGAGLSNLAAVNVDASSTWWGSACGPTIAANPGGNGDAVSANVVFSPWLGDGTDTSADVGFQPNLTPLYWTATSLAFTTAPGSALVGSTFVPSPAVTVMNEVGGEASQFVGQVTVAIGTNPGSGSLAGTPNVVAVAGVATFSGLSINQAGVGYTLVASGAGLSSGTSAPFTIFGSPANTVWVDDDYTASACGGHVWNYDAFTGIQAAVNAVAAAGTVNVAAGLYRESQIVINSALTLQGAGVGLSILDGGDALLASPGLVRILAAGDVAVDGFTIRNAGGPVWVGGDNGDNKENYGMWVKSTSSSAVYTISHVKIIGQVAAYPNDDYDYGLRSDGGQEKLVFTHSEITGTGANSIIMSQHAGETEISDNILDTHTEASGPIYYMTFGGVNVATPQTIANNTIDISFSGTSASFDSAISFQSAWGNPNGSGGFANVAITGNRITGVCYRRRGIDLYNGASTGTGGEITGVIRGNSIEGTGDVSGNSHFGIRLAGKLAIGEITGNTISGAARGIRLLKSAYNTTYLPTVTRINHNSFSGHSVLGIDWAGTSALNAPNNWWGSAKGPTIAANPGGNGDAVSANVVFSPWLGDGSDTSVEVGFQPNPAPLYWTPTTLVFTTQPGAARAGSAMVPQPVVTVRNEIGGVAEQFVGAVAMAIGANPGPGILSGTSPKSALAGVATFTDLSIDKGATGYTLVATFPGLTSATSTSFDVRDAVTVFMFK